MPYFEATAVARVRLRHRPAPAQALLIIAAFCSALAGCQRSETIPTTSDRLSAVKQIQETRPDFYLPRKSVDYISDIKAIKDEAAKAEPVKAAAAAPPKPAPHPAPAPAPATPIHVAEPAAPAPAPVHVASAAPTLAPAPTPIEDLGRVNVISREQPEFPKDAMRQGVESATVLARMTINAAGNVTAVTIVQARPVRLFDSSVKTSLSHWKFNAGADGRTYETEVSFKLQ